MRHIQRMYLLSWAPHRAARGAVAYYQQRGTCGGRPVLVALLLVALYSAVSSRWNWPAGEISPVWLERGETGLRAERGCVALG